MPQRRPGHFWLQKEVESVRQENVRLLKSFHHVDIKRAVLEERCKRYGDRIVTWGGGSGGREREGQGVRARSLGPPSRPLSRPPARPRGPPTCPPVHLCKLNFLLVCLLARSIDPQQPNH